MDSSQILKRARSWAALCQRECTGRTTGSPPHGAKNMKSYFLPLVAVLCVVAAVGWTYSVQPIHQPTLPSAPPPESPAGGGVAGVGLVEPESENVQISCAVSGLVTGLYVKAGERVSKGQRLFSLDDRGRARAGAAYRERYLSTRRQGRGCRAASLELPGRCGEA